MSVSDSLATGTTSASSSNNDPSPNTSNEPIYHTLDDESGAGTSFGPRLAPPSGSGRYRSSKGEPDDNSVYINSALEVVYPTSTMLRKQQQILEQMGQEDSDGRQEFDRLLGD